MNNIQKTILRRHEIIRNNQNVKEFALRRLTSECDNIINNYISNEIRRLKSELWEKEREYEINTTKVNKNQRRLEI